MRSTLIAALLPYLTAVVTAVPTPQGGPICLAPIFTGTPPTITATSDGPAQGLLLDDTDKEESGGTAILDSTGLGGRLIFEDGTIGAYVGHCTPYYLNIGESNFSYKTLSWTTDKVPGIWNANFSQTIEATATDEYSASTKFVACRGFGSSSWNVFLQTGAEIPSASFQCTETELYVSADTLHEVGTK